MGSGEQHRFDRDSSLDRDETIARTAALDHGAVVANHAPVIALHKDADGKLTGATVDAGARGQIEVRAKAIVNATGVWIDAEAVFAARE